MNRVGGRSRHFRQPRNAGAESGFSLAEALVTSVIVSIISLAIVSIISRLTGAVASLTVGTNLVALQRDLQLAVSTTTLCQQSFVAPPGLPPFSLNTSLAAGLAANGKGQEVSVVLPGGTQVVAAGTNLPGYRVKVDHLLLSDATHQYNDVNNNPVWAAKLTLYPSSPTAASVGGGPSSLNARPISDVMLTVNGATGATLGCYAGLTVTPGRQNCIVQNWTNKPYQGSFTGQWASQGDPIPANVGGGAPVTWAMCPPNFYMVGVRGTALSTGSKDKFLYGQALCCQLGQ
jgi:type II secretory pathway pseudopilin PulG